MRQRFGVAVALLGNPKLIIVDEPTAGLDPAERVRFLNLLSEIGEDSVVILSTHIVEDVEELCSRMAIIDRGEILLEAEPLRAIDELRGRIWRRTVSRDELPALERELPVISTKLLAGRTIVHVYAEASPGAEFEPVEPDLKDVYFSVMARHTCAGGRRWRRRRRREAPRGLPLRARVPPAQRLDLDLRRDPVPASRSAMFLATAGRRRRRRHVNAPAAARRGLRDRRACSACWSSAALFGDAAVRDVAGRMDPLLFTSPLAQGRIPRRPVPRRAGGQRRRPAGDPARAPGRRHADGTIDPERFGPFRVGAYLQPFLLFLLPNLVLVGAILFTIGMLARQVIPVYLGAIGLFIGYVVALNYAEPDREPDAGRAGRPARDRRR